MNIFDYMNPLKHFSEAQYLGFWQMLFATFLEGFWARMLAVTSLVLSFWYGVRRQRLLIGTVFFTCAVFFSYGAVVMRLVGLLK